MPLTHFLVGGWRLIICLLGGLFSAAVLAQSNPNVSDNSNKPSAEVAADLPIVETLLDPVDAPRTLISKEFVSWASSMDSFFGDSRYFEEANHSVLQINLTKVFQPGGAGLVAWDGQAKLDLPLMQRRFSLMLESDPEKNSATGNNKSGALVLPSGTVSTANQSLALRYDNHDISPFYFSADIGVKAQMPLETFARSRVSYGMPLGDWQLKATENLFWFRTIGTGESTQLDFDKKISQPLLFRASSNATWLVEKLNFDLRQDFSFYHTLNERSAMLYQTSVIGVSQPQWQATEYVLLMLYRYRLHQKWIYYELSPQLHYPIAQNFQVNSLLLFRMEFLFDENK